MNQLGRTGMLDDIDRRLIKATQAGLPIVREPYAALASEIGISAADVMSRLERMLANGIIRRIGAVPNHYRLGYGANGMSVWDVDDERVQSLGRVIGDLDFVSHCYQRPRHLPDWPYNFFAMVHGREREIVERRVDKIAALLGDACHGNDVLYSTRILKKTGLRLVD